MELMKKDMDSRLSKLEESQKQDKQEVQPVQHTKGNCVIAGKVSFGI